MNPVALIKLNIMSTSRVATDASTIATPVAVSSGTAPVNAAVIFGINIKSKNNIAGSKRSAINSATTMSTATESGVFGGCSGLPSKLLQLVAFNNSAGAS
jgi:hypothetical protein